VRSGAHPTALEQMEQCGVVSAMQSNGNRDILVPAANAE
jgi:S-DNA-T family DNA segregation ATPase FtsK/SpoIIIE